MAAAADRADARHTMAAAHGADVIRRGERGVVRRIEQWRKRVAEARLLAYREDLADWLQGVLGVDLDEANLMTALETGVLLCQLARKIDNHEAQWQYELPIRPRVPNQVSILVDAKRGSFQARANVSEFLRWATALGVPSYLLFETDDLVLRKNEKQVLHCLMDVTRTQTAFKPASIMAAEQEVLNILNGERPPVHAALRRHHLLNARLHALGRPPVVAPDTLGRYALLDEVDRVFVRCCGGLVMVRMGPREWIPLVAYFADMEAAVGGQLPTQEELLKSIRQDKAEARQRLRPQSSQDATEQPKAKQDAPPVTVPEPTVLLERKTPVDLRTPPRSPMPPPSASASTSTGSTLADKLARRYRARASPNPRYAAEFQRTRERFAAKFKPLIAPALQPTQPRVNSKTTGADATSLVCGSSVSDSLEMLESDGTASDFEEITAEDFDTKSTSPPLTSNCLATALDQTLLRDALEPVVPAATPHTSPLPPAVPATVSPIPLPPKIELGSTRLQWSAAESSRSTHVLFHSLPVPKTRRISVDEPRRSSEAAPPTVVSLGQWPLCPPQMELPIKRFVRAVHRPSSTQTASQAAEPVVPLHHDACSSARPSSRVAAKSLQVAQTSPLQPVFPVDGPLLRTTTRKTVFRPMCLTPLTVSVPQTNPVAPQAPAMPVARTHRVTQTVETRHSEQTRTRFWQRERSCTTDGAPARVPHGILPDPRVETVSPGEAAAMLQARVHFNTRIQKP